MSDDDEDDDDFIAAASPLVRAPPLQTSVDTEAFRPYLERTPASARRQSRDERPRHKPRRLNLTEDVFDARRSAGRPQSTRNKASAKKERSRSKRMAASPKRIVKHRRCSVQEAPAAPSCLKSKMESRALKREVEELRGVLDRYFERLNGQ